MYKIFIEGKKGLLKKLETNTKVSKLRDLLKNEITDEYYFGTNDDFRISKEDENEFTLQEIVVNGNHINIKKDSKNKIMIYENQTKIEEVESSDDITLDTLRSLSKILTLNDIFISNDGLEVSQNDEKDFQIKDILNNGIVKIIKKNVINDPKEEGKEAIEKKMKLDNINKIYIKKEEEMIMELENIEPKCYLSTLRDLCGDKIPENSLFIFLGNLIEKEKEKEILICNIIDKKNCIYLKVQKIKENKEINETNEEKNEKNEIDEKKNNKLSNFFNHFESLTMFFKDYISPELETEGIKKEYDYFKEKYGQYKGIKRFAIPVFGIISSGKSTLLNYLLNLNEILEMEEEISTQFICIIRNKKGLKKPKLYSVKLISRDEKYFNFIKDKEIDGDIKTIISEKNESIKNFNTNRKPEEYFLMIESDIPFLNEGEDDFGDLFEFLDFPGVNESNIKEGKKTDLFYKDYLPIIIPNIQFCIFIFEVNKFEGIESENLIEYYKNFSKEFNYPYLEQMCTKTYKNSIFILNKIDLLSNQEKIDEQMSIFREKFEFSEKNTIYFSSKEKLLENNKFNSFYQFIEYVI